MFQRLADGLFAIAGAATLSQFPAFFQQYLQRLGGRLDQASVQAARIAAAARDHGLETTEYVRRLVANADPLVQSQGENVSAALADATRLRETFDALNAATPISRPLELARHFDENLTRATLEQFVPAVPLNPEGLVYAAIGMLIGLMILAAGQGTIRSVRGPGRHSRRA